MDAVTHLAPTVGVRGRLRCPRRGPCFLLSAASGLLARPHRRRPSRLCQRSGRLPLAPSAPAERAGDSPNKTVELVSNFNRPIFCLNVSDYIYRIEKERVIQP